MRKVILTIVGIFFPMVVFATSTIPWFTNNDIGIFPSQINGIEVDVLIGGNTTTTQDTLEVQGSIATTDSGSTFISSIWNYLNLGLFFIPRITGDSGALGPLISMPSTLLVQEKSAPDTVTATTSPAVLLCDELITSCFHLIYEPVGSTAYFKDALIYSFDSGIQPAGIIDSSGDYGTVGQVLSNPAGGGNLDWIDTTVFGSKWTEFNQASRDTLLPVVSLGVSRVAVGPTNLIASADTALNVSGGSINVASSTLLMLSEVPFITNCDFETDDISSYSVCVGGTQTNITAGVGIHNVLMGYSAGQNITTGINNSMIGPYAGNALNDDSNNIGIGFQTLQAATTGNKNTVIGVESLFSALYASTTATLGYRAGYNATTTDSSVFIGHEAGYGAFAWGNVVAPPSSANTVVGYRSMYGAQSSMTGNSLLGFESGYTLAESDYNTFLGYRAGYSMFSQNYNNVAIGLNAMYGNIAVGATSNTALGDSALFSITTGDSNVAVGEDACFSMTTGGSNFCLGEGSGYSGINVSENTSIGTSALFGNITGSENVAIGSSALQRNQSATTSVAVGNEAGQGTGNYSAQGGSYFGYQAGENVQTGSDWNTFLGYRAGALNTTGASSTILGFLSGDNITTGSHNLILGGNIDAPSATASNQLNIGNILFGTAIDGIGSVLSTGNIGVATTSPSSTFDVYGSFSGRYKEIGATYTMTATDYTANATSSTFTVNLPTTSGIAGRIYNIKNSGTGTLTIDASGSETIDGLLTHTLIQYAGLTIQATGSTTASWIITSRM